MFDPRDTLFSPIRDRTVTACIYADMDGLLSGVKKALDAAAEIGLAVDYALDEGADLVSGDMILQVHGTPIQIAKAEDRLIGCLAKSAR